VRTVIEHVAFRLIVLVGMLAILLVFGSATLVGEPISIELVSQFVWYKSSFELWILFLAAALYFCFRYMHRFRNVALVPLTYLFCQFFFWISLFTSVQLMELHFVGRGFPILAIIGLLLTILAMLEVSKPKTVAIVVAAVSVCLIALVPHVVHLIGSLS